jgi:phage shock protein A
MPASRPRPVATHPIGENRMIFGKIFAAIRAQFNKVANLFWSADPIAMMRYEYDRSVAEMQDGRKGLELYRALVEKVTRQVREQEAHMAKLEAQAKAYLKAGDRETASKFALEMEKLRKDVEENRGQLKMHEQAYDNNLRKIQHATKKLAEVRQRIDRQEAELKMSEAEAEVAKLAEQFNFNVTTDFGQVESVLQDRIDKNRAKVRVAADMSNRGMVEIEAEQQMEQQMAEDALSRLEASMGIRTPETLPPVAPAQKTLGPAQEN